MPKHTEYASKHIKPLSSQQISFSTEPKTHRIRRGQTITIRRCQEVMKHLWQMGLKTVATRQSIEGAIFFCVGADPRTIRKYLGYNTLLSRGNALCPPQTLYIPGYLEKLRYISRLKAANYFLHHKTVPKPYHYAEQLIPPDPPLPNSVNGKVSKPVLCVCSEGEEVDCQTDGATSVGKNKNNNNSSAHTNQSSESILSPEELAILKAVPREVPDRGKVTWEVKLCRNCGKPRETGSQIWFQCPEDNKWRTASDICDREI